MLICTQTLLKFFSLEFTTYIHLHNTDSILLYNKLQFLGDLQTSDVTATRTPNIPISPHDPVHPGHITTEEDQIERTHDAGRRHRGVF